MTAPQDSLPKLPEKIETTRSIDGYYEVQRPDRDILDDLVETTNALVDYVAHLSQTIEIKKEIK